MVIVYILLAIAAGSMLPMQGAMNARLARTLGSPIWAAALSGIVLTAALTCVAWISARGGPRTAGLALLPWWAWAGGFAGALLLAATASLTPRLGAASLIALVIAGQILCSLVLDSFGLLGLESHPFNLKRAFAAVLLLTGAALMP